MKYTHVVGIDEAGRGPLAGPVAVGVAMISCNFDWRLLPGVNDSKKLSEAERARIFMRAVHLRKCGVLRYFVSLTASSVIDKCGITAAVDRGIRRGLLALAPDPSSTIIKLDGLLSAPDKFMHQKTLIGGDSQERIIGLASILAKVTRDRYMIRLAAAYPGYGLEIHKGYGTKKHRLCIAEFGLSDIHRRSFCRKFMQIGVPLE